jgi:NADPH:quinone reductase-like Zn-dependent oxidoreductase
VTTCSPRNFDYVKSLGATAAFDYNSPTCGADIRALTSNSLHYVWDCIGEDASYDISAEALASSAGPGQKLVHAAILFPPENPPRSDVEYGWTIGYSGEGYAFELASWKFEAKPEDYEFAKKWIPFAGRLYAEGKVKPSKVELREGGLDGILDGLKDLKEGKVSAAKLVYRVQEP